MAPFEGRMCEVLGCTRTLLHVPSSATSPRMVKSESVIRIDSQTALSPEMASVQPAW
jgi:hypothetical protein